MNTVIECLNSAGAWFIAFVLPMLIQSGVLILFILGIDVLIRKKVRAVFRYGLWMLVLVKLMLPTSLSSPTSLGYWIGIPIPEFQQSSQDTNPVPQEPIVPPSMTYTDPLTPERLETIPIPKTTETMVYDTSPIVPVEIENDPVAAATPITIPAPIEPAPRFTWQAIVLLVWGLIVLILFLLLVQRVFFVRQLVAQARNARGTVIAVFNQCRIKMGIHKTIPIKLSVNAASPSVCGLFRPVILFPYSLVNQLTRSELESVLLHELAHIKRKDLWVNLWQTVLQILYFFHPLLWLANAIIRRIREQAVDEAVLVAMQRDAEEYSNTLVRVFRLSLQRQALSLRLIGVVESKTSLTTRIKHILSRPLPKSAKLGILGILIVFLLGAILLPMAEARRMQKEAEAAVSADTTDEKLKSSDTLNSSSEEKPVEKTGVNIYLLEDENMDLRTARKKPISQLALKKKPWISSDDILRYDASSHCIHLRKNISIPLKKRSLRGNPFVVTVDGQRCYLGALRSHGSSFLPEATTPLIYTPDFYYPDDIVAIELLRITSSGSDYKPTEDVRNDRRVLKALRENGQYHGGLNLRLDNIEVLRKNNDFSVSYTYTLTNKDTDNLYVFDPTKMGTGLFHYFTNGLGLYSPDRKVGLGPDLKKVVEKPEKSDKIDMAWFSLLKSGESMTRTVILGGYPEILPDKYECSFIYHSPNTRKLSKGQFRQADGRFWIGEIGANLKTSVQVEGEELWGEVVDGVQVRLKSAKRMWNQGDDPSFKVDFRNNGTRELQTSLLASLALEIDGKPYAPRTWWHLGIIRVLPFGPGKEYNLDIKLSQFVADGKGADKLPPGKHTIKAVLLNNNSADGRGLISSLSRYKEMALAFSEPVEISIILAEDKWGQPVNGLRAAVEFSSEKTSYTQGETVAVRFHVQNISDHDIEFKSISSRQDWPSVKDSGQKDVKVERRFHSGTVYTRTHTIKPTEVLVLNTTGLGFAEENQTFDDFKTAKAPYIGSLILSDPGVYAIHYQINPNLKTGIRKVTIVEKPQIAANQFTMQQVVETLVKKYRIRLCFEDIISDAGADVATEPYLLTGNFKAQTIPPLLDQITQSGPFTWKKYNDTYVIFPRKNSLLEFPASLNIDDSPLEFVARKVLDKIPTGKEIEISIDTDDSKPNTYKRGNVRHLLISSSPVRYALTRAAEESGRGNTEIVWTFTQEQGRNHLTFHYLPRRQNSNESKVSTPAENSAEVSSGEERKVP